MKNTMNKTNILSVLLAIAIVLSSFYAFSFGKDLKANAACAHKHKVTTYTSLTGIHHSKKVKCKDCGKVLSKKTEKHTIKTTIAKHYYIYHGKNCFDERYHSKVKQCVICKKYRNELELSHNWTLKSKVKQGTKYKYTYYCKACGGTKTKLKNK